MPPSTFGHPWATFPSCSLAPLISPGPVLLEPHCHLFLLPLPTWTSASGASRPGVNPATLTPASALGRGSHEVMPTLSQRLTSMPLSKASPSIEEEMKASPVLRTFQFPDKDVPGPRSSAHVVSP